MRSPLRQLAWPIIRGVLPYPDLARRLQVRRAAKALITCKSWPEDDETTGLHIAQLALLRTLRLQQDTRRLTHGRHHEAAVLVSRSALESCILGVYCLFAENAVNDLRGNNLRTDLTAITALLDQIVPRDLLKEAVKTLGTPRQAPNIRDMVEHIDKTLGGDRMSKLYSLVYGPVSNYFTHAAGSLIRHVRPDNKLGNNPETPGYADPQFAWRMRAWEFWLNTSPAPNRSPPTSSPATHRIIWIGSSHHSQASQSNASGQRQVYSRSHARSSMFDRCNLP